MAGSTSDPFKEWLGLTREKILASGKRRTPWTTEELAIFGVAGPSARAKDLISLLPNRTICAIQTKILRYQHRAEPTPVIITTDVQNISVESNKTNPPPDLQADSSSEVPTNITSTGVTPGTHFSPINTGITSLTRLEHTNEDSNNTIITYIKEILEDPERKIDPNFTNLVKMLRGETTPIFIFNHILPPKSYSNPIKKDLKLVLN